MSQLACGVWWCHTEWRLPGGSHDLDLDSINCWFVICSFIVKNITKNVTNSRFLYSTLSFYFAHVQLLPIFEDNLFFINFIKIISIFYPYRFQTGTDLLSVECTLHTNVQYSSIERLQNNFYQMQLHEKFNARNDWFQITSNERFIPIINSQFFLFSFCFRNITEMFDNTMTGEYNWQQHW